MTTFPAAPSTSFDPADPAFRADPYPAYRELRERAPLARLPDRSVWLVTGYDEVRSLLRDPRTGAEQPPPVPMRAVRGQHSFLRAREESRQLLSSFMHHRAPADHTRLRRLAQPAFSPSRVQARRTRIQELTDDRLAPAVARGRLDIVNDLGRPIALAIAAEVLGIPEAMRPAFGTWARELVHRSEIGRERAGQERRILAMTALAPRVRELIAGWRARPPAEANLLWALEQARDRGALSEKEVVAQGVFLLFAGHITSQHLIGNGVLALLRRPDQWELLRARPVLIGTAVDELLRYDTPAAVVKRTALDDIEIGAETIRRGEALVLLLGAANRDPAVFADPDRLDIMRSPNPHLGFGHDAHYCLGAALARLQAEVVIGTLVRRVPPPRLESEELEWEDPFIIRGLTSLPILLA